jgi:DNA-binding MarR family transcriptional regulator
VPKTAAPPVGVLASALRVSVVRFNRRLRFHASRAVGWQAVSMAERAALSALDRLGPMTPGALAAHQKVTPPSMTRVLASLEHSGYVLRRPHPTDGRQAIVELTGPGQELLSEEVRAHEAWLCKRISELSREDQETLRNAVGVIDRLLES